MNKYFLKPFLISLALTVSAIMYAEAQSNIWAFYEYGIKSGMETEFINGYKADLEWQKTQKDNWSWIGWFVLNGERRGRFIDATPNHAWKDFDTWVVDRSENARHNVIHFLPYTENSSGAYRKLLINHSVIADQFWYQSAMIQAYGFKIKFGQEGLFEDFLLFLKKSFMSQYPNRSWVSLKTVSGDVHSDYMILIPLVNNEELALLESLFETLLAKTYSVKETTETLRKASAAVESRTSELWGYRKDLSMYNDTK